MRSAIIAASLATAVLAAPQGWGSPAGYTTEGSGWGSSDGSWGTTTIEPTTTTTPVAATTPVAYTTPVVVTSTPEVSPVTYSSVETSTEETSAITVTVSTTSAWSGAWTSSTPVAATTATTTPVAPYPITSTVTSAWGYSASAVASGTGAVKPSSSAYAPVPATGAAGTLQTGGLLAAIGAFAALLL